MLREKHLPGPATEPEEQPSTPDGEFVDLSAGAPASTLNRVVLAVWLVSLAAMIGVGIAHVVIMRAELRDHEIRRAVDDVRERVDLVLEHSVPQELLDGDPDAIADFDTIVREHLVRATTAGLALWTKDGRIVYALDQRFNGQLRKLPTSAQQALDTQQVVAGTAVHDNDEEAGWAPSSAIEVYAPFVNQTGEPLIWEVGLRRDTINEQANRLVFIIALLTALGAGLLLTVQGLLARSLVHRHDRERAYRRWLTQRVSEVATVERRQIAADLHDGVVQDLTGIALDLEIPDHTALDAPLGAEERSSLARRIRAAVTVLRGQAAELHPTASAHIDEVTTLGDMLRRVPPTIQTRLDVRKGASVSPSYRWLVFRVAQESLRNAVQHSRATRIEITLRRADSGTVVTITDDGVGFSPESDPVKPGHMGLSLVSDMAAAAGANLSIRSAPGKGTTIRLEVPS